MIVLSGALVLVALVLLVFGALDRNLPYVYASIGVSLLSLLLLFVGILQRRGELTGDEPDEATTPVTDTTAEPVPALAGAGEHAAPADGQTAELAVPAPAQVPAEQEQPASRRVVTDVDAEQVHEDVADDRDVDERDDDAALDDTDPDDADPDDADPDDADPDDAEDDDAAYEDEGSGVVVLVVSGRPRYHLEGCRVLRGKEPQPLDRDDARMHGFTPCGVCKPDADETDAQPQADGDDGQSFTEALFGEPLFAEPPADQGERVPTSELPGRPVQPVLAGVEPAAVQDEQEPPAAPTGEQVEPAGELRADQPLEPPVELRGDDPADDPTVEPDDAGAAEPAPDVAANPDEVVEAPVAEPAPSADSDDDVPVLAPAAGHDVAAEPVEIAPVRPRASSRRSAGRRGEATEAAAEEAAATTATVDEAPAQTQAADGAAAAGTAPARTSPARKAPAKKAPAKKAPAKKAPAKKAAAKQAPAEKAPAKAAAQAPPAAPAVKRPMVRAVRADALRLGAPSTGGTTTRVSARGAAPAAGASVVVVPDRDRFHRPECRYARGVAGATALPKASAARQGYTACGVCKP